MRGMKYILIIFFLLATNVFAEEDLAEKFGLGVEQSGDGGMQVELELELELPPYIYEPLTTLAFVSPDGRRAEIDFGGDNVTCSGDLPVEESAKMLFEAYGSLMPKCECDKGCMENKE